MSVEKKVKEIVVEHLGVDLAAVTQKSAFIEDLNADSLDLTELVMTFEEHFGFDICDEDAAKLVTVGDAITYIEARLALAEAGASTK